MLKNGLSHRFLYVVAGGLSLAIAGWSPPATAAAHAAAGCDKTAQDLKSLRVDDALRVESVDLSDVAGSSEDTADDLTESVAPLLFLTPRVASILQDVFGDSDDDVTTDVAAVEVGMAGPKNREEAASSPVVDNAASERAEPAVSPMYENAAILPRFQRQMYRTDI